ncbi:hypothetical protein SUGI_1131510 [Cryptomeria japonica]|nr:hypothetical protein SUGI_1131510 [Cryptomeria japonica]
MGFSYRKSVSILVNSRRSHFPTIIFFGQQLVLHSYTTEAEDLNSACVALAYELLLGEGYAVIGARLQGLKQNLKIWAGDRVFFVKRSHCACNWISCSRTALCFCSFWSSRNKNKKPLNQVFFVRRSRCGYN